MKEYQLDNGQFCGYVKVDDKDTILVTMPILRKFIGQPLKNLVKWTNHNFKYCILKELNENSEILRRN